MYHLLDRLDLAPLVRRRIGTAVAAVSERQEEPVGLPVIGIAATAAFHADKAKGFCLTDGRGNRVVIHAVVHEVLLRDRQVAVFAAAMTGVLDLDP